ncbi:hypothetical protein Tsubulata_022910 [Turnera subulata]|uniref:CST complex subunit CTC1 n=1 Tax=Turnera subulata TaxID=218843 RepID=A0A9Q0FX00_9ROSI|nr:hypothetical protein Tsubulata_022910 [Turnera subulata]
MIFPFACVDDGSSLCCCWANAERAAALLSLHGQLTPSVLDCGAHSLKWVGKDKSLWKSKLHHLERILKKHDRITVKNYGSMTDSAYQNLTVSTSSDDLLSCLDEDLLKIMIFNACSSTSLTVVARVMDATFVKGLEKEHLMEMETMENPMLNVWAVDVCGTDTVSEARSIVLKLLNR